MSKIYTSMDQMIGRTPLLELCRIQQQLGLEARVLAKLEYLNPAGSVKDRAALSMIRDAEQKGLLKEGSVIVEPTSGNTGIGLAAVAAARGYRVVIVMPETMSLERRQLMRAYGAELVLTEGSKGMSGAVEKAQQLVQQIPGAFLAGQFTNPANPQAHFETTGPEIWQDTEGHVDVFVAGVGTGGTITGVGRYLKSQDPAVRIVGVEPAASPLLSKGTAGPHKIQGIGANFVPQVLDTAIYDELLAVTDQDAFAAGRLMARTEGVLVGISSGAALWAAVELAKRPENRGKTIVTLLPALFRRVLQGASLLLLHPMGRQQQCANVLAAGAVTVFVPGTGTAGTDKGAVGPQPALRPAALPAAAHQSAEMPHPPAAGLFLQVPHLVFQLAGVGQDLLPQQIADLFSVHVPSPSRCVFKSSIG